VWRAVLHLVVVLRKLLQQQQLLRLPRVVLLAGNAFIWKSSLQIRCTCR
jgi:hypothetical protein